MCASYRRRTRFRQPEVLYFALLNQLHHRARDVFDRNGGIDAVLVQHVNRGDLQSRQHRVDDAPNVVGPAIDAIAGSVGIDAEAELGGDHDLIPDRAQRFADEDLVRERPVRLGGVEQGHATFDRRPDDRDTLLPIRRRTVHGFEPHAPISERGHHKSVVAEGSSLHGPPHPCLRYVAPRLAAPTERPATP
jgi:hypothetical protein